MQQEHPTQIRPNQVSLENFQPNVSLGLASNYPNWSPSCNGPNNLPYPIHSSKMSFQFLNYLITEL